MKIYNIKNKYWRRSLLIFSFIIFIIIVPVFVMADLIVNFCKGIVAAFQETFDNCKAFEGIGKDIKKCWKSY